MRVRDGRARVVRDERDDFLVTDDDGKYFGICRTPDVLNPPRMQIILVDHNEAGQAIGALDEAELIEVLDHHRLGNSPTRMPIPFTVDPVGSTSTLVTERIQTAGLQPLAKLAGVLLAGILSDTLVLKSPTTTPRDQAAVQWLAGRALGIAEGALPFADYLAYGEAILSAGAGLALRDLASILQNDLKLYEGGGVRFAIAQVEAPNLLELGARLPDLTGALQALCQTRGLALAVLMVTDVVRGISRLVVAGEAGRLNDLPYTRLPDGTLEAPGVVSRKKQLLPAILGLLE
jgi:manganese-dependent inorganic pyrophosphatase